MISRSIKLFAIWTMVPICSLTLWALFTQPHQVVSKKPDTGKIQRDLYVLNHLFPAEYKVTESKIEGDFISVYVDPSITFTSRDQIRAEASRLVRIVNNVFPGKRIIVRIDKPLPNKMVQRYGNGYYDGRTSIETEAY